MTKLEDKKILVIGSPGSGKSYFSRELSKIIKLPVYHLDKYYWRENWEKMSREDFTKLLDQIMNSDSWIIDGNYQGTLEMRLNKAELVFFLDLPARVCLRSERKRRNVQREDFPSFLNEGEDPEFVKYIKEFPKKNRGIILDCFAKYPNVKVVIFKSRREINKFLNALEILES